MRSETRRTWGFGKPSAAKNRLRAMVRVDHRTAVAECAFESLEFFGEYFGIATRRMSSFLFTEESELI